MTDKSSTTSSNSSTINWKRSTEEDSNNLLPQKKTKRNAKPSSSDIKYAERLYDAFNSGDLEKLKAFLAENCTSDCKLMACERKESDGISTVVNMAAIVAGLNAVILHWEQALFAWPDGLFSVNDSKITTLADDKLAVVCSYSFAGTRIFYPQPVYDDGGHVAEYQRGPLLVKDDDFERDIQINDPRRRFIGTLTMPLNDDRKIEAFQFYYSFLDSLKTPIASTRSSSPNNSTSNFGSASGNK